VILIVKKKSLTS